MYDIIIKNGAILDGTGAREFVGDVGIREGMIATVGNLNGERAEKTIDAKGHYVAPGFVDINNHSDTYWQIFLNPDLESLVRQGITTIVGGNCGSSLAPLTDKSMLQSIQKWTDIRNLNLNWLSTREFLEEVERRELSVNFATLLGHGTLRRGFVHDESRPLQAAELSGMAKMVKQSLHEGSLGMSLGLAYVHGRHATEHELSTLASVVGKANGFCTAHLRNEGKELPEAIAEAITMARSSGVRLHISHLKAVGRRYWEQMERALYLLEASDSEGVDVSFDIYPYRQTATVLYTILPTWITDGGKKMMMERLRDKSIRLEAIHDLKEERIDYSSAILSISSLNKMILRTNVLDMARSQGKLPEEVIFDVLLASDDRAIVSLDALSEDNIEKGLRHPFSIVSTNGTGYPLAHARTGEGIHPRCFGAFPRVLFRYVRERRILGWEEAIHKMTGKPALKAGIKKRGTIAVGNHADLVVINPNEVEDHATAENPYQYPSGIPFVVVNGKLVIDKGEYTGARAGTVIRREGSFLEKLW
jgi:N-acyl-D-amino-acid deacylase